MKDGRPLSDLIELDKHSRKCLEFEATLTDQQIEMLQDLGYLPVTTRQYAEELSLIHICIFAMTIDGFGPYQIAKKLSEEKILIPSAYLSLIHI